MPWNADQVRKLSWKNALSSQSLWARECGWLRAWKQKPLLNTVSQFIDVYERDKEERQQQRKQAGRWRKRIREREGRRCRKRRTRPLCTDEVWHGSPIGSLKYFITKHSFRSIFQGSQTIIFQLLDGAMAVLETNLRVVQVAVIVLPLSEVSNAFVLNVPSSLCPWLSVPLGAIGVNSRFRLSKLAIGVLTRKVHHPYMGKVPNVLPRIRQSTSPASLA